jgi:uncharacterized protein (TIGR03790 family)
MLSVLAKHLALSPKARSFAITLRMTRACITVAAAVVLIHAQTAAASLRPDEIALVVNKNVPDSLKLAQFYMQARQIPAGRIIELDLPSTDEMPFDRFERDVTPPVRQFLREHNLQSKVRCLVTFYGVPLRVSDRINSPRDTNELGRVKEQFRLVQAKLGQMVQDVEKQAAALDKSFRPASNADTFEALTERAERAGKSIERSMQSIADPQVRKQVTDFTVQTMAKFAGPVDVPEFPQSPASAPTTAPASAPATTMPINELLERPFDAASREQLRALTRRSAGIFGFGRILQNHIEYLTPDATGSAVDSDLALLRWPHYQRQRWQPNPLNPHFSEFKDRAPPVVMVTRIDAPTPQIARDLMANSVEVERVGLKGKLVIDTRGIAETDATGKHDPFGIFDERLRRLATIAQTKTNLQVVLDTKPEVLSANSVDDVALYCGWYSVRNYVPGMKFNRGAVGYHVASFELVSLRAEHEGGWVRGLMYAGVVGTVGPVAEPYLHSFPAPDEFFPLLLTGKMTLAEVYWTTVPLASWMQTCIGDPLYTPYAKNPAMKVQDLPDVLKPVVDHP